MDIDIKEMFNESEPMDFAASYAETGNRNIARDTWENALTAGSQIRYLMGLPARVAFAKFLNDAGLLEDGLENWPAEKLEALFIQYVAGDVREGQLKAPGHDWNGIAWGEYEKQSDNGRVSGRLFCGENGVVYFQID